ncbi:MAG: polysaccharide biosynthesis C-terminal domain-containing protein, partial [Bacillota bacterium]
MGRYRTLLSNTLIFTISDFSSKLLVFFMLPIYTRVMTTGDFGVSDLINSTVGLLMPVFTLSIADGALRFAMRPDVEDKQVFTFGMKVIFAGFGILLLAFPIFLQIGVIKDYLLLFYLTYITSGMYNFLNQFARGINKIKLVGICGMLSTFIVVTLNIVLLFVFRLGVTGYLVSFILSYITSSVVLFAGGGMYKYLSAKHSEKRLKTDMLKYSIPLAPNSISWWLNNTANRYIIATFCGVSQVGLFSAAVRIPTILTTLQGVFMQAWQLSAISEYEKQDRDNFYVNVYTSFNLASVFVCSLLIILTKLIASLLFSKEFYEAWQYVPLLLVSTMFGALAGFVGIPFSAINKTKILFVTTLVGGVVSVICNYLLVPFLGPTGASIASVISYVTIWTLRLIESMKYIKMVQHPYRDVFCYLLLIIQAVLIMNTEGIGGYAGAIVCCVFMVVININDIHRISINIKKL